MKRVFYILSGFVTLVFGIITPARAAQSDFHKKIDSCITIKLELTKGGQETTGTGGPPLPR